jgi:hypothetical protein
VIDAYDMDGAGLIPEPLAGSTEPDSERLEAEFGWQQRCHPNIETAVTSCPDASGTPH